MRFSGSLTWSDTRYFYRIPLPSLSTVGYIQEASKTSIDHVADIEGGRYRFRTVLSDTFTRNAKLETRTSGECGRYRFHTFRVVLS